MKGKKVRQINNYIIRYTEVYEYAVWSPYGVCLEDRLSLEQAINFASNDFTFCKKGEINYG